MDCMAETSPLELCCCNGAISPRLFAQTWGPCTQEFLLEVETEKITMSIAHILKTRELLNELLSAYERERELVAER